MAHETKKRDYRSSISLQQCNYEWAVANIIPDVQAIEDIICEPRNNRSPITDKLSGELFKARGKTG